MISEKAGPEGIFRIQIREDGKLVGDSGWQKNQITNLGYDQYLCQSLTGAAGKKSVTHLGIGTGTAPGAAATTLDGELASRVTVSTSTVSSKTAQFTCTFASSVFSTQGVKTISNLGLFETSSGGTLFAGNTYTGSQWNTNQDVQATYQIRFT
jgi:hypothetical protein